MAAEAVRDVGAVCGGGAVRNGAGGCMASEQADTGLWGMSAVVFQSDRGIAPGGVTIHTKAAIRPGLTRPSAVITKTFFLV
jgi:hypothetical protein